MSLDRYYDNDKGDCFPCSKCCQDDQDVVADECKQKMGAGSNMVCSFDSSVNRCDQSTPSPEPTTITNQGTTTNDASSPSQGSKHQHTVPPTAQTRHHLSTTEIAVVVLSVLVALLIFSCLYKARQKFRYPCCSGDTETGITNPVNSASQSCMVHDKPTEDNLGRIPVKYCVFLHCIMQGGGGGGGGKQLPIHSLL